ncbi:Protein of unknown function [Prosthecobacter debontii]|uniref:DUF2490 domain-containing protein n=1 Tax=Prosthecobacter debontii TaxID=48467 RepID=A0A1T4YDA2_9BACT|nr:DUF2490 domain-containing protein [Prosthecobacter debontii]SKA99663.1 Protein of unknown function [Prosthecobacter debontii]
MLKTATHTQENNPGLKTLFFAALSLFSLEVTAEASDNELDSNAHVWMTYVGDHPLGDGPWGLHLEGQVRRSDLVDEWQQWMVRPGLNYTLSPSLTLSAGWAYAKTYPYGDYPVAFDFPEHRAWEQITYSVKALGLEWQNRLRLEQRWIGEMERTGNDWNVENWRYENRIRYMLRTTLPLTASKKTYLAFSEEIFVNFGSNVSGNFFDQNRLFLGVGHKLSPHTRIELGFLEQTIQRRGGAIWENNHTFTVTLASNWPFKKKAKPLSLP